MKQKKLKGASPRAGRKRRGPKAAYNVGRQYTTFEDLTDVSPSTSLPPLVEGQLRCFLKLTVSKILWTVSKPPASFLVRVRWWGETSDGTVFVPRDTSQTEPKALKTTTRYPVRCGPKQFASYLTDMGALILEVTTKSVHLPIGRVQIGGLAQLSPSHPISGFFTIVSPTSEKMGEVQVSLVLEPLSETYDSSSSLPNTDMSFSVGLPAQGAKEAAKSVPLLAPPQLQKPPGTGVTGRESVSSSRASTPRGKDHLYFQEDSENVGPSRPQQQRPFPGSSDPEAEAKAVGGRQNPVRVLSCNNPATKDLLSALLDQGRRLRDAMVVSAMKSSPDSGVELCDTRLATKQEATKLTGNLRRNLKNLNPGLASAIEGPLPLSTDYPEFDLHAEDQAIHLLLDGSDLSPVRLLDGTGSPPESLSLGSDVCSSELNDPHYDQSLLENLFYTAQKSDSSLSGFLSEEDAAAAAAASGKQDASPKTRPPAAPKALQPSPLGERGNAPETKSRPRETSGESPEETQAVNLSLDRLAVLSRIHLARVVIESLKIPPEETAGSTPGKKTTAGKPPRPTREKKRTFFVEYKFPVGASKNGIGQVAVTTEIVRVASSKIAGEVVKFQQRYVFPVHFSGSMITHWWNSDLEFNMFLKKGTERKPLWIGSAAFPLRDVVQSEQLMIHHQLPVQADGGPAQVGPLKVSLELAADHKDFASTSARTVSAVGPTPLYSIRSPGMTLQDANRPPTAAESSRLLKPSERRSIGKNQAPPGGPRVGTSQPSVPCNLLSRLVSPDEEEEETPLLLHVLLMVPEGQVLAPRDARALPSCNVYLNCKLFHSEGATRSAVVWGTTKPTFHFSQVTPISLTAKHLERLKNNVMVLEAWNKVHGAGGDRLLGLAKLPLHQFYVSFRDPRVSHLLLQAQYPVLAVDGPMPLVDVFSGGTSGTLTVILAMGSAEQIAALQRLKNEEGPGPPGVLRPPHSLDPLAAPLPKLPARGKEGWTEHVFKIRLERVRGLTPLQSTVWGEADCYVQYHFPVQEPESDMLRGTEFSEKGLRLQPFRSATTLCLPDPTLDDERHHSLSVPADVPVQRLLLAAFSAQGLAGGGGGGGGGISFEIWCRYYYPNVRDQMVARGTLPLSRLCALVTLQHRQEVGIQTFSLPLAPRTESLGETHPRSSGFLDVSIGYRRSLKITEGILAAQTVSLSVQIHFAAGLQAAARVLAEKNPLLQYSAEVGINAYVSVHLPFLPETERRNTRPVARTFCPEFEHHVEFPCNLVVQRSGGGACCLAELLHLSEVVFSLFHKPLNSAPHAAKPHPSGDYLLGTVKVPTRDLLIRRSGIRGWYPVTLPEDLVPSHPTGVLQSVAGGLELSVCFAHPEDRERVLDAAKLLGWNWDDADTETLQEDSEGESQSTPNLATVTVSIPRLWLPLHSVLLAGQAQLNKRVYCYLRYKLYDQEATWTSLRRPRVADDPERVTVAYKKSQALDLPHGPALLWYFREEKLEFQVWQAHGNESNVERPLDTDRLIGSAYVDLLGLSKSSGKKRTVSGVFPLFRRNASDLSGAAVRVHIAVASARPDGLDSAEDGSRRGSSDSEREDKQNVPDPGVELHLEPSPSDAHILAEKAEESPPAVDHEKTFAASVLVEKAMHLSLKGSPLTERGVTSPSSYVSFVATDADHPIATEVVEQTDSPVWGFQQQTRLSKDLLLDPQQTLVFKVWHKAEVERVIGFASVDLSPLLSGFHVVCGWYNITDFSGQCQGQIKVAVSPLENIAHLKEERQARSQTRTPGASAPARNPSAFQPRVSYPALPVFPTRGAEELFISAQGPDSASDEKVGSCGRPRHEEHVQNIRRFHESLQQVEGNAQQAWALDPLAHSSRSSVLGTLRRNLGELDEIQRYFRQKLARPFPHLGGAAAAVQTGTENPGPGHPGPAPGAVNAEGRQLLEKSNRLVSQVSSLITDLQNNIMRNAEDAPGAHVDGSGRSSASEPLCDVQGLKEGTFGIQTLVGAPRNQPCHACVGEEPVFPQSFGGRGTVYEFLDQADSHEDPHVAHGTQGEGEAESPSEEEYEEDILEPRTLNEITVVTNRTSPWSSLVSEPEPGAAVGAAEEGLPDARGRSSSPSSGTPEGARSLPGTARSSSSPCREEGYKACRARRGSEDGTEEPGLHTCLSHADQEEEEGPGENQRETQQEPQEMEENAAEGQLFLSTHGAQEVLRAGTLGPESAKGGERLCGRCPGEEAAGSSEEGDQPRPGSFHNAQQMRSGPGESWDGDPEEIPNTSKPHVVLSDPVLVPNFFLPPEHLEASMRLLSVSSAPPLSAPSKPGSGGDAATVGIPSRRTPRPKLNLPPAELPEEETKRIARIFSAQFS